MLPEIYQILTMLEYMKETKMKSRITSWNTVYESFDRLKYSVLSLGVILLIFTSIATFVSVRYISMPINYLSRLTLELADGKIPTPDEKLERTMPNDEIKTMANALKKLIVNTTETIRFAKQVGAGKYEVQYRLLSEEDELGKALTEMRDNLAKAQRDGFIRNWTNTGIGLFADILRKRYDSQDLLVNEVLKHIVHYIKANQGAFFLVEGGLQGQQPYLVAKATIAWDKPKFMEKKFLLGEGLIGQAWQEKSTLYITDIPENHIEITSGLGHKNPTCILIVPLIFNNVVYGVLELASFHYLEKYEIDFIEKVCESFAATISNFRNDTLNTMLIKDHEMLSKQLKEKESEIAR
ncbi:MAG: GAF domain-containing protein, partial [Flammeovirgaceae bacterium]|nr:GAF domain-containing protein [Flammeovirgaceae bacterium]